MSFGAASGRLMAWKRSPLLFVREELGLEPDAWQCDVLEAFPRNQRLAMKACKGPGKTALLAWLAWNFLLTRVDAKIAAASITSDNLRDGLWTEMAKWQRKSRILSLEFTWQKTRVIHNKYPETWYMSARTWDRNADPNSQSLTLAGLHADNLLFLLDEAGGIPDAVMAAAEAGLANATPDGSRGLEAHLVLAGNPTHLEGPLYRACTQERDLWHVTEITADPDDPKRTPRVSVEWARQQIAKYGRDNPFVLVNVFGKFPPSSLNTLLGPDEVRAAMERGLRLEDYQNAAKVIGVDVGREDDDPSIIFPRQGRLALTPIVLSNVDGIQGAGHVAAKWREISADGCFIDNTGGFGGSWLDQLRAIGFRPQGIHFAGKPQDERYANKRAEIWFALAQWVKEGGALPNCPELVAELSVPQYFFKGDKVQIEDKEDIKARLGRSPNHADALALTFSAPVFAQTHLTQQRRRRQREGHDPFAGI